MATALAEEGVHVIVNGRGAERVDAAVERLLQEHPGTNPTGLVADFGQPDGVVSDVFSFGGDIRQSDDELKMPMLVLVETSISPDLEILPCDSRRELHELLKELSSSQMSLQFQVR